MSVISGKEIISMILVFTLILVLGESLIHSGKGAKEGKKSRQSFIRLKSNPEIFESLTQKQKQIIPPSSDMGIMLGKSDARHTLIKVCNPYCGPCAKAHPEIAELLTQNPDLRVQIIFTATNDEGDRKGLPVRHLLAIAHQGDATKTKKALDDWYLAKEKNYERFAALYPMNGQLEQQRDHVERMRQWCDQTEIRHTPTYFLNGFELPEIYAIGDLGYFLKS